ncbi:hypothetical protein [Taklimakanibacter deserti]|uniref:hypothetical protein n=1 Tax=Taklimakanibacter deserti TaxID=2267839 RepID=UPI000E657184
MPLAREEMLFGAATRLHMMISKSAPLIAGRECMTSRITFAVPEYATYDFWAFYPNFWIDETDTTNSPERDIANAATVYGSFEFAGIFHPTLFEGSQSCTLAANTAGKWGSIPTFTSPGAQRGWARTIHQANIGDVRPIGYSRMSSMNEAAQWSATPNLGLLSGGAITNTASGRYYGPACAVARGNDGRLVPLVLINSIDFSEDETVSLADARANVGFWQRGFDENVTGPRLPYMNFAVPGTRCSGQCSLVPGAFLRRDEVIQGLANTPFDLAVFGDENDANVDASAWRARMDEMLDFLNDRYGIPCAYRTCLPKAAFSNNRPFTTLADQIVASDARLALNTGLLSSPAPAVMTFDIGAVVHDAVETDKWKLRSFSAALTSDFAGGTGPVVMHAAPVKGELLVFGDGTAGHQKSTVIGVSGSGPYSVTLTLPIGAYATGHVVKAAPNDGDGKHPTTPVDIECAAVVATNKINLFQYDAASTALFARFLAQPTYTHKKRIDIFIKALKAGANAWGSLDAIYGIAGHDAQGAQRNWKADAFNLTVAGAPVFTAFQGYETDGIDDELDTGFNPSTSGGLFQQNSGALGIFNLRDAQFTNSIAGFFDGTRGTTINPRTASNVATARVNQTGATTGVVANADGRGLYIASRKSGSAGGMTMMKDGATLLLTSNIVSTAPVNASFRLGRPTATSFAQAKFALALIGTALTPTQQAEIHAAAREYLESVAAI